MPTPDPSRRRLLAWSGAAAAGLALPRSARALDPVAALESRAPDGLHDTFTLCNATVVRADGSRLAASGIRVEAGRVVEVGPAVTSGVDVGGRWIVPGFTDAGCTVGMVEIGAESATNDSSEGSDAVVPDARAIDAYNPLSDVIGVTRAYGITTALIHPQPNRLVAGQAALVHTRGRTRAAAEVQAPAALVVCLGGAGRGEQGPSSRMGVQARLRALFAAVELPEPPAEGRRRKKNGGEPPTEDGDLSPVDLVWRRALQGKLPVLFKAERADDILVAVALAREWGLRAALLGGAEAWIVAEELAEAEMPALIGPVTAQPGSFEHPHARYDNAAMLHRRGVPFGFRTGSAHFSRGLSTSAGVAVAHGLPWEAAVQALTRAPGEILGIEGVGRIAPGSPATFFVSDGDPLQPRHAVRRVWIGGEEQRMDHRQRRLFERFRELD